MNKAFIFDMDGVIIASEKPWHDYLDQIWPDLVGENIAKVFTVPVGMAPKTIYEEAIKHGSAITEEYFMQRFNEIANKVYQESLITDYTEMLGEYLLSHDYHMGLVSSSCMPWIKTVLNRLSFGSMIEYIVSINDRQDLLPKPSPMSYIETIKHLKSSPEMTIILEDSNSGILAAKQAGAYTIGFTANLLPGYDQHGADIYASSMEEVIGIVDIMNKS